MYSLNMNIGCLWLVVIVTFIIIVRLEVIGFIVVHLTKTSSLVYVKFEFICKNK